MFSMNSIKRKRNRKLRSWVKLALVFVCFAVIGCVFCLHDNSKKEEQDLTVKLELEEQSKAQIFEIKNPYYTLNDYQAINPYVFGMLIFEDESITRRIPVVEAKSETMADYWMSHNVFNEADSLGSAFLDAQTPLNQGNNYRINGHASYANSRMFTFVQKYKDQQYFQNNPTFNFEDNLGTSRYEVIFMANYDVSQEIAYGAYWLNNQLSKENVMQLLQMDEKQIIHQREVNLATDGKYITLVTCDMNNENYRYVLFAHEIERKL